VEKKQIFIKDMSEISLYIDSHLVGKRGARKEGKYIVYFALTELSDV
jgi:hypothetical protein